jgi:hypothetical protein
MSHQRVIVEHVIGGMKRYKCLVDKFRNKKDGINNLFVYLFSCWVMEFKYTLSLIF